MAALVSILVVLSVSLIVMRVGATALALTGVSDEAARFQAQSAFLGVGFTTRESELVLAHPVRRRIVMLLMLLGNAGVVAGISSVVLLFLSSPGAAGWEHGLTLLAGVAAFWAAVSSRWLDRRLSRAVEWALRRWTRLDVRDYVSLLRLAGQYGVVELEVGPTAWVAERTLAELDLRSEGILVLGIERSDGTYVGVPRGPTRVLVDDVLLLYGRAPLLEALGHRSDGDDGDREHAEAVERHRRVLGLDHAQVLSAAS